jgi:hypothetical protein
MPRTLSFFFESSTVGLGLAWRGRYHGVGATDVVDPRSDDWGCALIHKNARSNPCHWLVILQPLSNHTLSLLESSKRNPVFFINKPIVHLSGTIIRGTLKTPNSQLVTPISIKLLRPDGCD